MGLLSAHPVVKQSSGFEQGDSNGQQVLTFGCSVTADGGEASTEAPQLSELCQVFKET